MKVEDVLGGSKRWSFAQQAILNQVLALQDQFPVRGVLISEDFSNQIRRADRNTVRKSKLEIEGTFLGLATILDPTLKDGFVLVGDRAAWEGHMKRLLGART